MTFVPKRHYKVMLFSSLFLLIIFFILYFWCISMLSHVVSSSKSCNSVISFLCKLDDPLFLSNGYKMECIIGSVNWEFQYPEILIILTREVDGKTTAYFSSSYTGTKWEFRWKKFKIHNWDHKNISVHVYLWTLHLNFHQSSATHSNWS